MTKRLDGRGAKKGTTPKLKLKKETLKDLKPRKEAGLKGGIWLTVWTYCESGCNKISKAPAATCVPCNSVSCPGPGGGCLMQ